MTQDGQSIKLPDGRALGFRIMGPADGKPVFFFHGTPGSRFCLTDVDRVTRMPGVRWILPERPGYGRSDPQPGRRLMDWPRDVAALADHLGVKSYAVAGISGGGPHAMACAAAGGGVSMAFLLASPSPAGFKGATQGMALGNRLGLLLQRYAPWLVRTLVRGNASACLKNPGRFLDALARQMPEPDRAAMAEPAMREGIAADLLEAYRQGSDAHADDGTLALTARDWGFNLGDIAVPTFMWHGELDTLVTRNMAAYLAREIPGCRATIVAGAGHLLTEQPQVVEEMRQALFGEVPSRRET